MSVLPPEIASRFEVIAKLGEGGMGTVYKVRHRDLDEIQEERLNDLEERFDQLLAAVQEIRRQLALPEVSIPEA